MQKFILFIALSLVLNILLASAQTINWQKKFASGNSGNAIQTLSDGGYVIAGGYNVGTVIRTNAQGDSLWGKRYGGGVNAMYLQTIASVSDGYVVAGSKNSHPYAMKIDTIGNMVWEHTLGGTAFGEINSLVAVADGIVFTGYLYASGNNNLLTAKLALNGDSLWLRTMGAHTTTSGRNVTGSTGYSIISIATGYVITGTADTEIYMQKIDPYGNRAWDRTYGGVHSIRDQDLGRSVKTTSDGGYVICGRTSLSNSSFDTEITLIKTASDGTRIWQQSVPGAGGTGYQVLVESDGYVLVGILGGSVRSGHIFKTDLQGGFVFDQLLTADYATGIDKATNGSYTVVGTSPSSGGMYLGNITGKASPRHFLIMDVNNNPIANKDVVFYKGTMQPGNDLRVVGQTTDANGKIAIDPAWFNAGDQIRAVIIAGVIPTQKPLHQDSIIQGVAFRILLDNVKFDERTTLPLTAVSFDTYSADPLLAEQRLTLNHTTVLFDLMVSTEWDADQAFTDDIKKGLLLVSNYLYDVFDGQVAIGKVEISDDKANWNGADICFTASTETWAHAGLIGYSNSRIGDGEQVLLPPRWFGSPDATRNNSTNPNWLSMFAEDTWRTLAHELGHQLFGFHDEYKDAYGKIIKDTVNGPYNLGYMSSQYSDTATYYATTLDKVFSTELSSQARYRELDKNNKQYVWTGTDCWSYFERQFEKSYGGVYCPITKPSERSTMAAGAFFLNGPNDKAYGTAPYDASSMLKATVFNKNTTLSQSVMTVSIPASPASTPANLVQTFLTKKSSGRKIDLGLTNKNGQIRFLGAEKGDTFSFSGNVGGKKTGQAVTLNGALSIPKKGDVSSAASDTSVLLSFVSGNFYVVPVVSVSGSGSYVISLSVNKAFSQAPVAEVPADNGPSQFAAFTFDAGNTVYSGHFDSLPSSGAIFTTASDDGNTPFMIPLHYSTSAIKGDIYGDNGGAWLSFDSANMSLLQNVTIVSSGFAPLRNGLDTNAQQGGNVHAIVFHPSGATIAGNNTITIRYSDEELFGQSASSLRIFKWNAGTLKWENIGGSVDTVHHEVNGTMVSVGTYAAFTISGSTGVIEKHGTIRGFTLSSNFGTAGTTVRLDLAQQESITLSISNSLGVLVGTLSSGVMNAGVHEFHVNATSLPSGMYFCTAKTNSGSKTVKVVVYR